MSDLDAPQPVTLPDVDEAQVCQPAHGEPRNGRKHVVVFQR